MMKICAWCNRFEGITIKGLSITHVMCEACKEHMWNLQHGSLKRIVLFKELPIIFLGLVISKVLPLTRKAIFKFKLAREHYLSQLQLMCRIMDLGVNRNLAIKICKVLTYKLY